MFRFPLSKQDNRISAEEAKQRLESDSSVILLDVRTPQEYAERHIAGSVNMPLDSLQAVVNAIPQKDTPLIVYCASGMRSAAAAVQLTRMGYTDISDLGGIHNWPYATEKGR